MSSAKRNAIPPPRERILQTARELFYRDGINAVSVDAIAAAADNEIPSHPIVMTKVTVNSP